MALKTIMLRRSIDLKKQQLEELRAKDKDFETREKELETAIGEAEDEEAQKGVSEEVEKFDTEKKAHEDAVNTLNAEIEGLEKDLTDLARKAPEPEKKANQSPLSVRFRRYLLRLISF